MLEIQLKELGQTIDLLFCQGYEHLSFIEAIKKEKKRILNLKGKWKEIQDS